MKWKRLYIQKEDSEGSATTGAMYDTIAAWGMYCAEVPWMVGGEAKDLPSNDWIDEDGLEEWMPTTGVPLKGYDMDLTFYCKGEPTKVEGRLTAFRDYLSGRDGTGCWMRVYSEYSVSGRRGVRFVSMSDNPDYMMTSRGVVGKIKVKVKVDDPVTRITLDGGQLKVES